MCGAQGGSNNTPEDTDQLSDLRYATVMVRLVIDRANRLVEGELVDLDGVLLGRFASCTGLARTMRRWLAPPRDGGAPLWKEPA